MLCTVSLFPELLALPLVLQFLLAVMSLAGGLKFAKYISRRLDVPAEHFYGPVSVFVPCRGNEPGLEKNLSAILSQQRDNFEIIFIVDSDDDSAIPIIESVASGNKKYKLIIAGKAKDSGQKVHNLLKGIESAGPESRAFVFVDSDARPSRNWLDNLLGPLTREDVGCSTGYRWFVQREGGFATHLRSSWNASIASSLGGETNSNFCWGGSMAIRREVFEELEVRKGWKGAVSDDFVLTNLIDKSDYRVHFEPKCLTASVGDCSIRELVEFTTRQMKITRVYSPGHFAISMIGAVIFSLALVSGITAAMLSSGMFFYFVIGITALIWFAGTLKAVLRVSAVRQCFPEYRQELVSQYISHALLWPVSTFLFLVNDIAALTSRTIIWRGITYTLVSDSKTKILDHE